MKLLLTVFMVTVTLFLSVSLYLLTERSLCSSKKWRAEVYRVGAALKNQTAPYTFCRGPRVSWSFEGRLL
ncbi:MAG: hypothetical protein LW878_04055 [Proteobacteria bacterium]|nr:hypothetical protein [Pseudomonadota bacterium]